MMKRDLKADLAWINRVTNNQTMKLADFQYRHRQIDFLARGYEGWPHAIERAIKAEALARELVAALQRVSGMLDYATDECRCGVCEYCNVQKRADKALAKAKEVLGDE